MNNVVFTQLSITELRQLIREEQTEASRTVMQELLFKKEKAKAEESTDRYLNKKEAAYIGNVCTSTIDNWIRAGHLQKYKLGEAVRIRLSDLMRYLESLAA